MGKLAHLKSEVQLDLKVQEEKHCVSLHIYFSIFGMLLCMNFYIIWSIHNKYVYASSLYSDLFHFLNVSKGFLLSG